tara:strand:+ start:725 stop:871 length:147 start_codon:yes stop_codon:yes gene_type:complete
LVAYIWTYKQTRDALKFKINRKRRLFFRKKIKILGGKKNKQTIKSEEL